MRGVGTMVRVGSSRGLVGRLRSETKGLRVRVKITGSGIRALESVVRALGRCQEFWGVGDGVGWDSGSYSAVEAGK